MVTEQGLVQLEQDVQAALTALENIRQSINDLDTKVEAGPGQSVGRWMVLFDQYHSMVVKAKQLDALITWVYAEPMQALALYE